MTRPSPSGISSVAVAEAANLSEEASERLARAWLRDRSSRRLSRALSAFWAGLGLFSLVVAPMPVWITILVWSASSALILPMLLESFSSRNPQLTSTIQELGLPDEETHRLATTFQSALSNKSLARQDELKLLIEAARGQRAFNRS